MKPKGFSGRAPVREECWFFMFSTFTVARAPYSTARLRTKPGSLVWICTLMMHSSSMNTMLSPISAMADRKASAMLSPKKGSAFSTMHSVQ